MAAQTALRVWINDYLALLAEGRAALEWEK